MQSFLFHVLANLRRQLPAFFAVLFACLGMIISLYTNISTEVAVISMAVVGLIAGLVVKKAVPDPRKKAL